jgi:hypothetical protein
MGATMTEPWYNAAHVIEHRGHTLVYQRGNSAHGRVHDSWIGVGPMDRIIVSVNGMIPVDTGIRFDPGIGQEAFESMVKRWYDEGAKRAAD